MKNLILSITFIIISLIFIACNENDPNGHIYCGEGNVYNKKLGVCVFNACEKGTKDKCDEGCVEYKMFPGTYRCYIVAEDYKQL